MMMKIIVCTTPIRPVPTSSPPFGSLAVIQSLRRAGYDPKFFDIDGLRPSFVEVVEHFRRERPDVVGISAVVSTAYAYVRRLAPAIREVSPNTRIILGGNLAASAELLHRRCGIDVCVIGEGERVIVNLARYFSDHPLEHDFDALAQIKGITFVNPAGDVVFTGYGTALRPDEFIDPDFEILERYSRIENYVEDPESRTDFRDDHRSRDPWRAGKRMSTVVSSKGCVARCTFCHRWDKGYRQIPPEAAIKRIQYLIDRYNVGFVQFNDENFGSDRKATDELIRLIKPLDILWVVHGVRARTLGPDLLTRMRDAGCTAVYCGFETGSQDLLGVMEKKLALSDNYDAARWIFEAGLYSAYQLVLAMPGESPATIRETIDMVNKITEFLPRSPIEYLSINYIQALPGTPVYEYARATGAIERTEDGEERYLLEISDVDASDDSKFLNFTGYPYLVVRTWKRLITYEAVVHWYRHEEGRKVENVQLDDYTEGGYFNRQRLLLSPELLSFLYPIRGVLIWGKTFITEFKKSPVLLAVRVWELLKWPFQKRPSERDIRSLRKVMQDLAQEPITESERNLMPLRLGR
ncbi:MAG: cobalamin B12-binding domain-containing protein [Nitrospirae bacterium]|nr:cobalamin B12-binding domain-containing protein [Nitrospirota bacterium]